MKAARVRLVLLVAAVLLVSLALLSPNAWALCPNCLGQNRSLTPTLELLGAFLLLPFLITYVVLRSIRRACRDLTRSG
jgi:hypothetical protein